MYDDDEQTRINNLINNAIESVKAILGHAEIEKDLMCKLALMIHANGLASATLDALKEEMGIIEKPNT